MVDGVTLLLIKQKFPILSSYSAMKKILFWAPHLFALTHDSRDWRVLPKAYNWDLPKSAFWLHSSVGVSKRLCANSCANLALHCKCHHHISYSSVTLVVDQFSYFSIFSLQSCDDDHLIFCPSMFLSERMLDSASLTVDCSWFYGELSDAIFSSS